MAIIVDLGRWTQKHHHQKIWTPEKIAVIILEFEKSSLLYSNVFIPYSNMLKKDVDWMANSVDADQTATSGTVWSESAIFSLSVQPLLRSLKVSYLRLTIDFLW